MMFVRFHTFTSSGQKLVPSDFLAPIDTFNPIAGGVHHKILLSNYFAQVRMGLSRDRPESVTRVV